MAVSEALPEVDRLTDRLRDHPGDADSAIALAGHALGCGREAQALPAVAALAAKANIASLWQWTGLLHRALDDHEKAFAAFERASRLAPRDALIAHSRARVALEAGLPAAALFDRAIALAPADAGILLGRAAARFADGQIGRAIAELDAITAGNPGWVAGHEQLARLRWMSDDRNGFTASYDRAITAVPRNAEIRRSLIISLVHAGQHDRALAAIEDGRRALGAQPFLDANEAAIRSEAGETDRAQALFDGLAHMNDITLAVWHVRHLLRSGRIDAAAAEAERFIGADNARLIWPYLGTAWRLLGDPRWNWLEADGGLVSIFDIAETLPPLDRLADLLRRLHLATHWHLDQSVRGGTQTDGALFRRIEPEIRQLRSAVATKVEEYVAALPPSDSNHPLLSPRRDFPPRFAGSWSVRLVDSGHHISHTHAAGWISSALYIALPDLSEPGHGGWLALGAPPPELGLDLPPTRMIQPIPGRLVLFPSTTWHATLPFTRGERLTIAFDVAPPVTG